MSLEAVIPCVHYDDYLSVTLPRIVDRLPSVTILTAPWDAKTIELAGRFSVNVMLTTAWTHGGPFNKGRALNEWIDQTVSLDKQNLWLLLLDADILLPHDRCLRVEDLDATGLYGAKRRVCEDPSSLISADGTYRPFNQFPLAIPPIRNNRVWGHRQTANPAAISGYMQLWCPSQSSGMSRLPESGTAASYDVDFALSFPETKRHFIHDFEVLHLGPRHVNWSGRQSPRWQPMS